LLAVRLRGMEGSHERAGEGREGEGLPGQEQVGAQEPRMAGAPPPAEAERVGHCRPPLATRFRPGESGNPRGRPRRKRHLGAVVARALRERITVEETDGRVRRLSKLEATVKQIVDGATKGDARATRLLFALIKADERALTEPERERSGALASEADALVIAELRRRLGGAQRSGADPSPPTPLPQGERGEAGRSSLPSAASIPSPLDGEGGGREPDA
jgi:Family of unknown function (DUF5681)